MKKIIFFFLLFLWPFSCFAIDLYSPKYIVYDTNEDQVLFSSRANENTAIASLTKIMSTLVFIENHSMEEKILVTNEMLKQVPWEAYKIKIEPKEYVASDLVYATLIASAADAVIPLAIYSNGSVDAFVYQMNLKAQELGLEHTHFTNPIGLDDIDNKATLEDVLKLLKKALKNDLFRQIYMTRQYTMSDGTVVHSSLKMYSEQLQLDTTRIMGCKTGATGEAGYAFSQVFQSNGHEILSITVGAPQTKDSYHIRDALTIISYLDEHYKDVVLSPKNHLIKTIKVEKSTIDHLEIHSKKEIIKYLSDEDSLDLFEIKEDLPDKIDYNTNKNLGTIQYYYNGELLEKENVVLDQEIKPTVLERLKRNWYFICIGMLIILILILLRKKCKLTKKSHKTREL